MVRLGLLIAGRRLRISLLVMYICLKYFAVDPIDAVAKHDVSAS